MVHVGKHVAVNIEDRRRIREAIEELRPIAQKLKQPPQDLGSKAAVNTDAWKNSRIQGRWSTHSIAPLEIVEQQDWSHPFWGLRHASVETLC